jgi:cytochrome c oxidase assembly protein subunit 15
VFAVPYIYFVLKRHLPDGYRVRLAALPVLTLAQGALGWYMVQSGLADRTSVSQYRLAAHLSLALAILAVAVWTYLELGPPVAGPRAGRAWRGWTLGATALIACTIIAGAFVAGLGAGKMYNTFPLMAGALAPSGYAQMSPAWVNPFENPIAAQFDHRVLALVSGVVALTLAWCAGASGLSRDVVRAIRVFGAVVLIQVALGVTTLLLAVPVALGVMHQFVGTLALTASLVMAQRVRAAA